MKFSDIILNWYDEHNRAISIKGELDPYRIWIIETILQQTRVKQGLPYVELFLQQVPDLKSLAQKTENEIITLWQGLGYYSRARNLWKAGQYLYFEKNGIFPSHFHDLLKMPGVGKSTAAAIVSFAFNAPFAVVDGNVMRVLARYTGYNENIYHSSSRKKLENLAQDNISQVSPNIYNQAMMDLGATICTPKKPKCSICPLFESCIAFQDNLVNVLPVNNKQKKVKTRYLNYFFIRVEDEIYVQKRKQKDIYQNMFEFFLVEKKSLIAPNELISYVNQYFPVQSDKIVFYESKKHILSHQILNVIITYLEIKEKIIPENSNGKYVKLDKMNELALPNPLRHFMNQFLLNL